MPVVPVVKYPRKPATDLMMTVIKKLMNLFRPFAVAKVFVEKYYNRPASMVVPHCVIPSVGPRQSAVMDLIMIAMEMSMKINHYNDVAKGFARPVTN